MSNAYYGYQQYRKSKVVTVGATAADNAYNRYKLYKPSFEFQKSMAIKHGDSLMPIVVDARAMSLLVMVYAKAGDEVGYRATKDCLIHLLAKEEDKAFTAWMWGRILLAAQKMDDQPQVSKARDYLIDFFAERQTSSDNLVFAALGLSCLAALNQEMYEASKKEMLLLAQDIEDEYRKSKKPNKPTLSNVLWVLIMNLQAAARAHDRETYEKMKIKIAGNESVAQALLALKEPVWALAKVRLAAATMGDEALFVALKEPVEQSIAQAKKGATAEYDLAVLDNGQANQVLIRELIEPSQESARSRPPRP